MKNIRKRLTPKPSFHMLLIKNLVSLLAIWGLLHVQPASAQEVVKPDPERSYQSIEGWGSSLCWWAHMIGQWEDEEKIDEIVDLITSPEKLNMNVFRYNIGGGDDPSHYSTENEPGHMANGKGVRAEMEGFKPGEHSDYDWTADAGQRKILLKIKEKRPDAVFEAFSNSAPYWMTYSGCSAGNHQANQDNLKPEYYDQFCDYLIEVCRHYRDEYGVEFRTLEPFNESSSNYWGYMGSQEGCHFDIDSQIALIRILHERLQASGLDIDISAADESLLWQAINGLQAYIAEGDIIAKLGQFNTHTYGGSKQEKKQLENLVKQTGLRFWQSETGPIGIEPSGVDAETNLENNLNLTQRMFDDLYLMKPEAWLDWQLFEEHNSTWCQLRGSFEQESFYPVKNFYVRMQVTRFIKQGYTLVESNHPGVLTALNPAGTELVIVMLNTTDDAKAFNLDLSAFHETAESAQLFRTSYAEDCKQLQATPVSNQNLRYNAPAMSISTFIVDVKAYDHASFSMVNGYFFEKGLDSRFSGSSLSVVNNSYKDIMNSSNNVLKVEGEFSYFFEKDFVTSEAMRYLHFKTRVPGGSDATASKLNGEIVLNGDDQWKDQVIALEPGVSLSELKFCNYSGLICNADSSRRRGFITSTESSYRNIKKKILTLACFQESFSSLQSFQQQSVV